MKDQLVRAGSVALAALLLAGSCQVLDSDAPISGTGTVEFVEVEGGCWVIESGGERYEPVDLPAEFREDGLRVTFEARHAEDVVSICMVGPLIEILEIDRAD